jgi:hypothetical protein
VSRYGPVVLRSESGVHELGSPSLPSILGDLRRSRPGWTARFFGTDRRGSFE